MFSSSNTSARRFVLRDITQQEQQQKETLVYWAMPRYKTLGAVVKTGASSIVSVPNGLAKMDAEMVSTAKNLPSVWQ
jgi:hypothetical protein